MTENMLLVLSNPVEGREDEYNAWYDETHVPEVLQLPGVTAAQRFRLSDTGGNSAGSEHSYLAVYELDRDPAEVLTALNSGIRDGSVNMSDAIDARTAKMIPYTAVGERRTSDG